MNVYCRSVCCRIDLHCCFIEWLVAFVVAVHETGMNRSRVTSIFTQQTAAVTDVTSRRNSLCPPFELPGIGVHPKIWVIWPRNIQGLNPKIYSNLRHVLHQYREMYFPVKLCDLYYDTHKNNSTNKKKTNRYLTAHNFGKCWPIFKNFSHSDSAVMCNELIIKELITP